MQAFVPKTRRPKFELHFRLIDLNNVPLVSGTSSIKWNLTASNAAEHSGKTPKFNIKDHKVVYDYEKTIQLRLVIGKDGVLQESVLHFEVLQEYQSSGRTERISLGVIKLNLAEYVDTGVSDQTEGGAITRRYLMQESKINSTLKIEIAMKHLEGDKSYTAPPLRTAPVFGGIAGIMSSDVAEAAQEEGAHMPSLSSKSREHGELQDMYRRTLAASWAAGPGEPRADDCIEDIFAGGDGWGGTRQQQRHNSNGTSRATTPTQSRPNVTMRDESDEDNPRMSRDSSVTNLSSVFSTGARKPKWSGTGGLSPKRMPVGARRPSPQRGGSSYAYGHPPDLREKLSSGALKQVGGSAGNGSGSVTGRTSLEQSVRKMERSGGPLRAAGGDAGRRDHEIDEFCNPYKEDLRSWRVREKAL